MIIASANLSKRKKYVCPSCKKRVYLKVGKIIRPHFAHYQEEACAMFSEGETEEHLDGKIQLAHHFKKIGRNVQLEAYLPNLQQRPDILFEKGKRKIAIEFQCSAISIENISLRTKGYLKAGYEVIWILGKHFNYNHKLTAVHKACLYYHANETELMLFHYDVVKQSLLIRYNFKLNDQGQIHEQLYNIKLNQIVRLNKIDQKDEENQERFTHNIGRAHKQLLKAMRYPSPKLQGFLQLIYQNQENIISMPKELYIRIPSEWIIQSHHMSWKYLFILWIESHSQKRILTKKMLRRWLKQNLNAGKIKFYESPQAKEDMLLKPFTDYLSFLEERKMVKKIQSGKWSYQQSLRRYKHLEEKLDSSSF